MTLLFDLIAMVLVVSESAFGIVINVFIMAVLIPDWVKNRTLNACYLILVCLSVSNLVFVCITNADLIFATLAASIYYSGIFCRIVYMFWYFANIFNSWLTACLCVAYCLKIVELKHRLFIQMKLRISKMAPWMILLSFSLSLTLSLPMYLESFPHLSPNATIDQAQNRRIDLSVLYTVVICVLGTGLPLLLVVFSLTLTLWSLCKHMRQMQKNATDFSPPQLEAHVVASRTMICLLTMYVGFCTANLLLILNNVKDTTLDIVLYILILFYAPAQSLVLVLGNSKLKQVLTRILCCACTG